MLWILAADLSWALGVSLLATVGSAPVSVALPIGMVGLIALGVVQVPAALWVEGPRKVWAMATGAVIGLAAALLVAWVTLRLTAAEEPYRWTIAAILHLGVLLYPLSPTYMNAYFWLPIELAVIGASMAGLAIWLTRAEGYDPKTMAVDGPLAQPERYSPTARATPVAAIILGAAGLVIVVNAALAYMPLSVGSVLTGESAPVFVIGGSPVWRLMFGAALAVAGLSGLTAAALHRIARWRAGELHEDASD